MREQSIRPLILAMLDGAISVGVLTVSGLVSLPVALLAAFAGAVAMAIGEYVSVENQTEATDIKLSANTAAGSSAAGFIVGSCPPIVAVAVGSWWVPIVVAALTLVLLAYGVYRLNGFKFAARALVLGELALGVSVAAGVVL